ncbi:uncharacterized protein PRCAT00004913001 [Priceomyces carsonii]|uniref:uncharacterized protein n=1 Tax=Priceomyces carsonii TaxID=28549 RepID=UPI002ED7764D|nr:unnamed protein product [Priceomyces carsonii]
MDESLPSRWEIELEFVQSLANMQYVNHLAQNNYLKNEEFLNYLNYLNYWREPEYAKYLVYPNCLHILTLLQSEQFRTNIVNPDFMNTIMNDMVKRWQDQEETFLDKPSTIGISEKEQNGNTNNPTSMASTSPESKQS